jgi:ABC-type multidrug transport system ATPase subunit
MLRADAVVAGWDKPATSPVDFSLQAGEIVGLTGPNGVGKSTLLAAFAGRARVFSGHLDLRPGLRLACRHRRCRRSTGCLSPGANCWH